MTREIVFAPGLSVLIDEEDEARVRPYRVSISGGYAWVNGIRDLSPKARSLGMHRFLMDAASGTEVDHLNGDTLDNRRLNLRVCTRLENSRNRPEKRLLQGRWMCLNELCRHVGMMRSTGHHLIRTGVVPCVNAGGKLLVIRREIDGACIQSLRLAVKEIEKVARPRHQAAIEQEWLERLAERFQCSRAEVMRRALVELARSEGLGA